MARREKNEQGRKTLLLLLPAFLIAALAIVLMVLLLVAVRRSPAGIEAKNSQSPETETKSMEEQTGKKEKWQEGTIRYQGKNYQYNQKIRTYLLMGIDQEGPVKEAEDSISGGQSDAMFLIVLDARKETLSIISINRNTMTKIEVTDAFGLSKDEVTAQICTQHGFGDGMHLSCTKAAEAVSYLFYHIPISGYLSMHMDAMAKLNDAVGGVEVEVLQDISVPSRKVELKMGEVVTLSGEEAYCYLRSRDTGEFDSATARLRRQEQFIGGFLEKAKTVIAGDTAKAAGIYDAISEYLVTNVDFLNLISELTAYEFEESRMYTVPGETVMGEQFEEFYPDEEALYDLIIRVFYEEVSE